MMKVKGMWAVIGILILCAIGCTSTPTPTPRATDTPRPTPTATFTPPSTRLERPVIRTTPTPTATLNPRDVEAINQLLADIFWETAKQLNLGPNPTFEDAKRTLSDFLFTGWDQSLLIIESYDIDPFVTMPYCINANGGAIGLASLDRSESPAEAGLHVSILIEMIQVMEIEENAARSEAGTIDSAQCREIENDIRRNLGWPLLDN